MQKKKTDQQATNPFDQVQTAQVYKDSIDLMCEDYISNLHDPEEIYKTNSNAFTGLIKYLSLNIKFPKIILKNIDLLNDLWNIYTSLCYKYNQKPIIEEYSLLLNINCDTIYSYINGETMRDYSETLNLSRSEVCKIWQKECKMNRYKGAAAGNVGYIFLSKAVDGLTETAPTQKIEITGTQPTATPLDIAKRHKVSANIAKQLPPKL